MAVGTSLTLKVAHKVVAMQQDTPDLLASSSYTVLITLFYTMIIMSILPRIISLSADAHTYPEHSSHITYVRGWQYRIDIKDDTKENSLPIPFSGCRKNHFMAKC